MESSFHTDGSQNDWTFTLFCSPFWQINHGGEFVIFEGEHAHDYTAVPYIPNRGVLFRADLPHYGAAPNRLCTKPRFSLAATFTEA